MWMRAPTAQLSAPLTHVSPSQYLRPAWTDTRRDTASLIVWAGQVGQILGRGDNISKFELPGCRHLTRTPEDVLSATC